MWAQFPPAHVDIAGVHTDTLSHSTPTGAPIGPHTRYRHTGMKMHTQSVQNGIAVTHLHTGTQPHRHIAIPPGYKASQELLLLIPAH